jgi:hypothetical protein
MIFLDKHNAYQNAMAQVRFDKRFEQQTLQRLAGELQRRRRKRLIYSAAAVACAAAAAITVIAVLGTGKPQAEPQTAEASAALSPAAAISSAQTPAATPDTRVVIVSSEYGGGLTDRMAPEPGQVDLDEGIRRALEDPANADAYFFVRIDIVTPEQYENTFSRYIYNGRTISEWYALVDLANGTYPYNEYNGDHGGNVTREQWQAAQQEAKTLDAQENSDAARAQYIAEIEPMLNAALTAREQSELTRLQQLGYDVFFVDTSTWAYTIPPFRVFAGLLSAEQLTDFAADAQCGYFFDWVHNFDGIVDWDEALRP